MHCDFGTKSLPVTIAPGEAFEYVLEVSCWRPGPRSQSFNLFLDTGKVLQTRNIVVSGFAVAVGNPSLRQGDDPIEASEVSNGDDSNSSNEEQIETNVEAGDSSEAEPDQDSTSADKSG
ncbi:MAG TPA: hypothetical protein PKD64_10085 [Pirellulaceae bacterium]|nr:hypothetical protein [Pirellulaceae bacterium]HMO92530.1 hypothetical protein [Pirellulaceae bacterium]HMP68987.1 hypothetical protein [Pirellulaceae bacterium]